MLLMLLLILLSIFFGLKRSLIYTSGILFVGLLFLTNIVVILNYSQSIILYSIILFTQLAFVMGVYYVFKYLNTYKWLYTNVLMLSKNIICQFLIILFILFPILLLLMPIPFAFIITLAVLYEMNVGRKLTFIALLLVSVGLFVYSYSANGLYDLLYRSFLQSPSMNNYILNSSFISIEEFINHLINMLYNYNNIIVYFVIIIISILITSAIKNKKSFVFSVIKLSVIMSFIWTFAYLIQMYFFENINNLLIFVIVNIIVYGLMSKYNKKVNRFSSKNYVINHKDLSFEYGFTFMIMFVSLLVALLLDIDNKLYLSLIIFISILIGTSIVDKDIFKKVSYDLFDDIILTYPYILSLIFVMYIYNALLYLNLEFISNLYLFGNIGFGILITLISMFSIMVDMNLIESIFSLIFDYNVLYNIDQLIFFIIIILSLIIGLMFNVFILFIILIIERKREVDFSKNIFKYLLVMYLFLIVIIEIVFYVNI